MLISDRRYEGVEGLRLVRLVSGFLMGVNWGLICGNWWGGLWVGCIYDRDIRKWYKFISKGLESLFS